MYIIFNSDGSIKKTDFNEFINKGSNNVNFIYIRVEPYSADQFYQDSYVVFKLPNGDAEPVTGTVDTYDFGGYYDEPVSCLKVSLSQAVTAYAGVLYCTCHMEMDGGGLLFTYPFQITVNDTHIAPEELTSANLSQYNNLKNYIDENVDEIGNVVESLKNTQLVVLNDISQADLSEYHDGQIFYDEATKRIYKKSNDSYINYFPNFAIPEFQLSEIGANNTIHTFCEAYNVPVGEFLMSFRALTNKFLITITKEENGESYRYRVGGVCIQGTSVNINAGTFINYIGDGNITFSSLFANYKKTALALYRHNIVIRYEGTSFFTCVIWDNSPTPLNTIVLLYNYDFSKSIGDPENIFVRERGGGYGDPRWVRFAFVTYNFATFGITTNVTPKFTEGDTSVSITDTVREY